MNKISHFLIILFLLQLMSCSINRGRDNISKNNLESKIINTNSIVKIEFAPYSGRYCIKSKKIFIGNTWYLLYHRRNMNYNILIDNNNLEAIFGDAKNYLDSIPDFLNTDSIVDLFFSSAINFKKGYPPKFINNNFYKSTNSETPMIIFNFNGKINLYKGIIESKNKKDTAFNNHATTNICCKTNTKELNFAVLNELNSTSSLSNEQIEKLKLSRINISQLDLFFCE